MKFLNILLASMLALTPIMVTAQEVPSYASSAGYAVPSDDQQIRGRVISFDGGYSLQVRDDANNIDQIHLHQGTIINPTGLTLQSGMVVDVYGYGNGSVFEANEIDTPYTYTNGDWYYNNHPWNYYDGVGFGLGFFFGSNLGWYHYHGGYYGHGYYGGHNGYHSYVHVNNVYNHTTYNHGSMAPGFHNSGGFHGGGGHTGGGAASHGGGGGSHR